MNTDTFTLEDRIMQFLSMNENASARFQHFLLAAIGNECSQIAAAVLTCDGYILMRHKGDCGYNDFTEWDIKNLSRNLNAVADVIQATSKQRREFFDKCVAVFDLIDGQVPILVPEF